MTKNLKRLLTQEQVMERLQISRVTLWRLRKQGLPVVQVGRAIRFDAQEVSKWLKTQGQIDPRL